MRSRLKNNDDGATLIIALVIITTVALVVGSLLGQSDTSVRATVALRDQAGSAYNGDGAAQAAINTLRNGSFNNQVGQNCFTGSNTLLLPSFYPGVSGQFGGAASSARVECVAEAGTGAQGSPVPITNSNKPGQAILTLSQTGVGQTYGQSNKPITIHGGVASNSGIDSTQAQLTVTGGVPVLARGACTGSITPACTSFSTPIADPNYSPPADAPGPPAGSLPACNNKNKIAEFQPGLYTNADTFNNCKASWLYFNPGTYFFDFTTGSTHVWSIGGTSQNSEAVGGTLTGAKTDTAPAVPNACVNPINSTSAVGVEFVFGGDSQLQFANNSSSEFCASYHTTSIPTVFYGLQASAGNLGSGVNTVHTQTGCVIAASGGCDVISTRSTGSQPTFFFEGFVYDPVGSLNLSVTNSTQPYFNFGIISRVLSLSTTGSACGTCAYISLPDNSVGFGTAATLLDLTVYVCPGAGSCNSGGNIALTTRVKVDDPTGSVVAGHRNITVLSWSQK